MKKSMLMGAVLSAGVASSTVAAPLQMSDQGKRDSVVFGTIATGALAGGPLGALFGAFAGSWLGEQVAAADQLDDSVAELANANAATEALAKKLAETEAAVSDDQPFALRQLQLELLFKTGVSELTLSAQLKMSLLASLLVEHPELMIRLDGYADPRGDQRFNQTLSEKRVQAVQAFLQAKGVAVERFSSFSHGASQSSAAAGDYDDYALERVVKVQMSSSASTKSRHQSLSDSFAQVAMP